MYAWKVVHSMRVHDVSWRKWVLTIGSVFFVFGGLLLANPFANDDMIPSKPLPAETDYEIGAYYFPGWHSKSRNWDDIQGKDSSRSPGKVWPDRIPLLGIYPEEESRVKDWHIKWAVEHGIRFFAYDWYWVNKKPILQHALKAHFKSRYRENIKFCILWANHYPEPKDSEGIRAVVRYWNEHLFSQPDYYKIDGKPLVIIFNPEQLRKNLGRRQVASAIKTMRNMVKDAGHKDMFLVAATNDLPRPEVIQRLLKEGYDAYTGWNYVNTMDSEKILPYSSLRQSYAKIWRMASQIDTLPYIVPVTPGWDDRPWAGRRAFVRENNTPDQFKMMLQNAKEVLDADSKNIVPRMLLIESWNEFGEGSFIEPARQWGFGYLDAIRDVFTRSVKHHEDKRPE